VLKSRNLPNPDRLSVLAATILLAYALTTFVNLPEKAFSIQLPGIFLEYNFNIRTLVVLIAAGLTASGTDWLLRDHPALKGRNTIEHILLPALTAWVIGIPLFQLPFGVAWWAVFAIGGVLLTLVLVAEYIVVDPEDVRHAIASAGLTAVSYALYLILAIVLRSAGVRLFLLLPALTLAAALVSLRTLHLRLIGQWKIWETIVIALVVGQIAAALQYWPLSPVAFGLAVLGPAYALTSLIGGLEEGEPVRQAVIEPLIVMGVICGAAVWFH
jgi:hypothetical protein